MKSYREIFESVEVSLNEKKEDKQFPNSNMLFKGFGKDSNGNSVIKVAFLNKPAFSIQTNGNLPKTHSKKGSFTDADLETFEKEVIEYVTKYGSKKQKDQLKVY